VTAATAVGIGANYSIDYGRNADSQASHRRLSACC